MTYLDFFTPTYLLKQGIQLQKEGQFKDAIASLKESQEQFQRLGDLSKQAKALFFLTLVAYNSGDYQAAISYGEKCLSLQPEGKVKQQVSKSA